MPQLSSDPRGCAHCGTCEAGRRSFQDEPVFCCDEHRKHYARCERKTIGAGRCAGCRRSLIAADASRCANRACKQRVIPWTRSACLRCAPKTYRNAALHGTEACSAACEEAANQRLNN